MLVEKSHLLVDSLNYIRSPLDRKGVGVDITVRLWSQVELEELVNQCLLMVYSLNYI